MRQTVFALLTICMLCTYAMSQDKAAKPARSGQRPAAAIPQAAPADDSFFIGPEDVLAINVWREPELTVARIAVRPDGKIGIPLLNDVQASGLTPKELQESITQGLTKFLATPNVSVLVVEVHSRTVHILGSVMRPGLYILGGPLTVVELLARAGGLTEFAKSENIQIVRMDKSKATRFPFNYKKFVEGSDFAQNIALRSGDVVTVP